MRFLAVGDIHFEALSTYLPDNYLIPVCDTLKQIWSYAKENNIKNIFLLGDIFDSPFPNDESKKAFLKSLDKLLNYYIILGNHDIATTKVNSLLLCKYFIEDLGLMNNVKFYFTPEEVIIDNIRFNMLPYPYKEPTINSPAICLGHFETKGSIADNGKPFNDGPVLNNKYQWILGHLHRQQGDLYPGSILQHRFGEPPNKYFFDCSIKDNNSKLIIEKVNINTPYKLLDIAVTKLSDLDDLNKDNIYRLFVSDHLDLNEIIEKTKDYHIWKISGVKKAELSLKNKISDIDVDFISQNLGDEIVYLRKWLEDKNNVDLTEEDIEKAIKIIENIKK